jgi:hypothetical protein
MLKSHTMRKKPVWHHPLAWLLGISFALATANGMIVPSFESIDEPQHFNFARYLAEGNGLPDQRDFALAEEYGYGQEGGQAPLYYWLCALILRGLGKDVGDVAVLTRPNPLSNCGNTSQPYSKGLWMRDPWRETWPYYGAALGVHVLRLFSAALVMLTVSGVYLTARTVFPAIHSVGLVTAALVGFNPRFLTTAAAVSNDNLLAALSAWGVYLTAATLRQGPSLVRSLALGVVTGLVLLTKVSGVFLLPLAVLALADVAWRERKWVRSLRHIALIGLLCMVIAGWWYVGNLIRYGNPGLVPLITQETGQRAHWRPYLVIPEIFKILYTYWAAAPYCEMRLGLFPVYAGLSLLGLVGLGLGMRCADPATRRGEALLLVWMGVIFISWFRFNAMVWAPDGRYLFPAHAAIAPLLAAGLLTLIGKWPEMPLKRRPRAIGIDTPGTGAASDGEGTPPGQRPIVHCSLSHCSLPGRGLQAVAWRGLIVGLGALAFVTPVRMLAPLFNPPPRYPADQVHIAHLLEASFGEQVQLLGYDVSSESLRAGDTVDVALYLQATRPITESLMLGLQLRSAAPGDEDVLVNFSSWPGGGNYPTTAWRPGEVLADRYRLPLPVDVQELQLWELTLIFLRPSWQGSSDERLPVRVGGVPGAPYVVLTRLRVEPGVVLPPPAEAVLDSPPAFGPEREVVLEAAEIKADGTDLRVALWWHVHKPLDKGYTVFVQLLDEGGRLVASGDGLPRGGAMPTDQWQAGDLVVDEHRIPLPEALPPGACDLRFAICDLRIGIGFYDPEGRLPAWDAAGQRLPEDVAILSEWR